MTELTSPHGPIIDHPLDPAVTDLLANLAFTGVLGKPPAATLEK